MLTYVNKCPNCNFRDLKCPAIGLLSEVIVLQSSVASKDVFVCVHVYVCASVRVCVCVQKKIKREILTENKKVRSRYRAYI